MVVFTHVLMCILGVLFMSVGFFATGIRGGLSRRGPYHPISKAGKFLFFLAGMAVLIGGSQWLLRHFGAPQVWWLRTLPFAAVGIVAIFLNSNRARTYMTGKIRTEPTVAMHFPTGLPLALTTLRFVFLMIVTAMVVFGVAPVAGATARAGIIACVLALFAIGFLYAALEQHYVNTGRATLTRLKDERPEPQHRG